MIENREIEYGATCKLKEWNMYCGIEGVEALNPINLTSDELARSTIIFEL